VFNHAQLKAFSRLLQDLSKIILGALCLAPLASDKFDPWLFNFGLILFGIFAAGSIIILKELKNGSIS
jgi:hypothetical protein